MPIDWVLWIQMRYQDIGHDLVIHVLDVPRRRLDCISYCCQRAESEEAKDGKDWFRWLDIPMCNLLDGLINLLNVSDARSEILALPCVAFVNSKPPNLIVSFCLFGLVCEETTSQSFAAPSSRSINNYLLDFSLFEMYAVVRAQIEKNSSVM